MTNEKIDKYDADYPYEHSDVHVEMSMYAYPIIERTNNGLLFPEGPKDEVDIKEMKSE